jgi:crotonobetaine/carnitine-CoA ligase
LPAPPDGTLAAISTARAEKDPDFRVLTFECGGKPDEHRSFGELFDRGRRLATVLIERGLGRGDRFGLMMRNHPEFVEAMIAASFSGTVFVPIDPRMRGEKLAYTLRNSGSRGLLLADYNLGQWDAVRATLPDVAFVLAAGTGEDGAPPLSDHSDVLPLAEALEPAKGADCRLEAASDPLQIIYTSGTTGDPKGVVMDNARFGLFSRLGEMLFGFGKGDVLYTGLSLTHGNAQAVTLGNALGMSLPAVISRRFTKSRLLDICRKHGCTTFSLLGGMATAIYSEPEKPDDADNPVRMVTSAGMPPTIWTEFERRFGVDILEWYGAVEGGLAVKPIGHGPVGSFGKGAPGIEMKILDADDRECAPFERGEICSRPQTGGPPVVNYYQNPEASQKKTHGGWLRSGDIGHADEEGWLFFDYRDGGGIRHNGDFVHPGYVEKVIAELPAVSDVFVYGVPAASGAPGEKDVVAAIVAAQGASLEAADVFARCREGLEPNFVPSYLQIVDEIPKTASEKPQERFLLDAFSETADNVFTPSDTPRRA